MATSNGVGYNQLRTHTAESSRESVVLELDGAIDLSTAPRFHDALQSILPGGRHIIVSFERVTYADGSAMRVLDAALSFMRGTPQQLVIVGSSPVVHKVLELSFGDTVRIFHSVAEAMVGIHGTPTVSMDSSVQS